MKEISIFAFLKILLIDNYDSFTYMLKDYIEQCGVLCSVMRNDDEKLLVEAEKYDGLVLSPGPQTPAQAGQLMSVIEQYKNHKPILGVCLGHQAIGLYFGAVLQKAIKPVHGKINEVNHYGNKLFQNIPSTFKATRYHSLILEQLPSDIDCIAQTSQNEIMGIAHKSLPLWGIQFHPESCTTVYGLMIIRNFLKHAQQIL